METLRSSARSAAFIELPENVRGRDSSAPRGNNPARAHQQPMNRKCAFTQITRFLTPEGNIVSCLFCTAVTELPGVWISLPLCFFFIFSPPAGWCWLCLVICVYFLALYCRASLSPARQERRPEVKCMYKEGMTTVFKFSQLAQLHFSDGKRKKKKLLWYFSRAVGSKSCYAEFQTSLWTKSTDFVGFLFPPPRRWEAGADVHQDSGLNWFDFGGQWTRSVRLNLNLLLRNKTSQQRREGNSWHRGCVRGFSGVFLLFFSIW